MMVERTLHVAARPNKSMKKVLERGVSRMRCRSASKTARIDGTRMLIADQRQSGRSWSSRTTTPGSLTFEVEGQSGDIRMAGDLKAHDVDTRFTALCSIQRNRRGRLTSVEDCQHKTVSAPIV